MKVQSLALKVYQELRRKILTNQLVPNTRLKEDIWAKKMEVNRMAVREALTRLLGERLVYVGEKGGYFVTAMTEQDVREIRQVREILEVGALHLCNAKKDKEIFQRLDKICDDFTSMVKSGYFSGAWEADLKFHETLVEASGNKKLLEAYYYCHIPLFHQKLGKTHIEPDDYAITDKEHRTIVKALKAGNPALAEKTLRQQFARGEAFVLDLE